MQNRNSKADSGTSASIEQNPMLSDAFPVEESNILIAEFMGWKELNDKQSWGLQVPEMLLINTEGEYVSKTGLKYHTSWHWLMPVVEEIESRNYYTFIIDNKNAYWYEDGKIMEGCSGNGMSKIESVWNAVVKFIKRYNSTVSVGI